MGMYDSLIVEGDLLPKGLPEWCYEDGHEFQTKDLENLLYTYVIHEDGTLHKGWIIGPGNNEGPFEDDTVAHHGDIRFYTTNMVMSSKDAVGILSNTGEEALFVVLKARFTSGLLEWIRVESIDNIANDRQIEVTNNRLYSHSHEEEE